MDQRDRELLEKQLRQLNVPSRHEGTAILMLVCMFLAGVTLGGIWFGPQNEHTRIASKDVMAAETPRNGDSPSAIP
jgi:hypothetical protein